EMFAIRNDLKRDGVDVTEDDFRRSAEHSLHSPNRLLLDFQVQPKRDPKRDARLKETLLADFRESDTQLLKLQEDLEQPEIDADGLRKALLSLADLREDFLKISQNFSVVQIDL